MPTNCCTSKKYQPLILLLKKLSCGDGEETFTKNTSFWTMKKKWSALAFFSDICVKWRGWRFKKKPQTNNGANWPAQNTAHGRIPARKSPFRLTKLSRSGQWGSTCASGRVGLRRGKWLAAPREQSVSASRRLKLTLARQVISWES